MMTLLWWIGGIVLYALAGSGVFLWIYSHDVYREIDCNCNDESPFGLAILGSILWPIGGLIWGGIFWYNKLIQIGDRIHNNRQLKREQDEKDKELANRGF